MTPVDLQPALAWTCPACGYRNTIPVAITLERLVCQRCRELSRPADHKDDPLRGVVCK